MGKFQRGLSDELSLWTRQLAWLHASPETKSGSTTTRSEKSRYEMLGDAAKLPDNPAPHLTDWLLEIGPTVADGAAIGWRDLGAWMQITGIELEPWEARLIRRLSQEYASMRYRAEKPDCAAPYTTEMVVKDSRDRVSDQFAAMVGAMKGAG